MYILNLQTKFSLSFGLDLIVLTSTWCCLSDRPNLASSYSFGALIELSVTNYHVLRLMSEGGIGPMARLNPQKTFGTMSASAERFLGPYS